MKLCELFEGKLKNLAIDREYDKKYSPTQPKMTHKIVIRGNDWREFSSELAALKAANTLKLKNPRLKVDVLPL